MGDWLSGHTPVHCTMSELFPKNILNISLTIFAFKIRGNVNWKYITVKQLLEKLPPYGRLFSTSCGELQPLAANNGALRAHFFWRYFLDFLGKHFW